MKAQNGNEPVRKILWRLSTFAPGLIQYIGRWIKQTARNSSR
jgi:hypothetical protein